MDLLSLCPLPAASFPWRRGAGFARTIVCKATFELAPDRARLAERQEALRDADEHHEGDPARSLYATSDLVPQKARADILLVGCAFTPGKVPARELVARLIVGSVDKTIEVHRDRAWTETGELLEGQDFTSMPIAYERAAGGPGTWNPVGVRLEAPPGPEGLRMVPNLLPKGAKPTPGARIAPVGFGPIAATWPTRLAKFGAHGALAALLNPLRDVPEDLDIGCFNAAPKDQQPSALAPDERIVLEGFDPVHARLQTTLPRLAPRAVVEIGRASNEVSMTPDTLWIDTDRRICTVTWRGTFLVESASVTGRIYLALEEGGRKVAWPTLLSRAKLPRLDMPRTATLTEADDIVELRAFDDEIETTVRSQRSTKPVLPFQSPSVPPPPPARLPTPEPVAVPPLPPKPPKLRSIVPAPTAAPSPATTSRIGPWAPPGTPLIAEAQEDSVLALSNAALGSDPPSRVSPAPTITSAEPPPAWRGDVLDLLWFDPAFVPRIRAWLPWSRLLATAKAEPSEPDRAAREKAREGKDQRDVTFVLRKGEPLDAAGLDAELEGAMAGGVFTPPLVITAGEIALVFDERETLKTTLALATPFAGNDKRLKELCDTARELVASPWLERSGLLSSLREAFAKGARGVAPGSLEVQTERILLEQRHFQTRTLLGEDWVRVLFTPSGADLALPLYLSEAATKQLPMFTRFRARVLAEMRLQLDQLESSSTALRAVSIARMIPHRGQ